MEKYAYMMEETDPVYFLSIKELLPEISEEKQLMAEKSLLFIWSGKGSGYQISKYPKTWKTGRRNWGRWNGQCKKLFKV